MNRQSLVALSVVLGLSGCAQEQASTKVESSKSMSTAKETLTRQEIDKIIDRYTQQFITHQPALATSLKLPESEYGSYQSRLPDYSVSGMQALQLDMAASAEQLAELSANVSNADDLLHVKVNEIIARYYAGDKAFPAGYIDTWGGHLPYIVNQLSGPLVDIPNIIKDQHTLETESDALSYIERLKAFAVLTTQVANKVKADAEKGVILPKVLFPNTLGYLRNFISAESSEHPLVISFEKRLAEVEGISEKDRVALVSTASDIVGQKIYPGFKEVINLMNSLEKKAPEKVGIWAQPNGDQYYQHAITYLADSDLSAEQIHQIGLNEVKRISKRMDEILKANGYIEGSVGDRMKQLNEEERFLYEDSNEGRQALLSFLREEIGTILEKAPSYFSTIPPQKVEVKRIPKAVEAGAPGGFYNGPSLDGSRPGVFSINLKDMKAVPSFGMKTLTYHEAVPGHHFQIALNLLQTDIGLMRQNASFNGYIEGWALYSELLAYEMGMYENDPFGDLGRLQAEAYRAARLVVDTGLHYKKWTRQQAIEYFAEATGTAMSDVVSAIDRYIAWPGQALGYKLGMLKLVELRDMAQQRLGDKFDIKAFHDVILLKGARPLALVEEDVNTWVSSLL
ncbi:DUF885 domain-containing protein [Pseudoalteromonas sp. T1lg65]|uniref:DUF885 domain-containing protein n=1 Tax=Pseudoalteromonas sp. T1lg65 TaxID=2077101 RepID=UPI003F7AB08A